ncbi:MAG: ABC transporter ATP-binding protein [Burkholderiaceae bacterium]
MNKTLISISNVCKSFGSVRAVDEVSLNVQENEFLALLGPSGCGKTTLLRMLAGLESPDSGDIVIDGSNMKDVAPNKRPVNMVFQSYAVFPHMTVEKNIAYGLKVTGVPEDQIKVAVRDALAMVELDHLAGRSPAQLSGGQRQRVALARALVKRPKVLLLDEPLSALDARLREQMQFELTELQRTLGITFIVVTHDQHEALSMSNRVAVMNGGKIAQLATPSVLYDRPVSQFVARFIGRVNILSGQLSGVDNDLLRFELADFGTLELPWSGSANGNSALALRPEHLMVTLGEPPVASGSNLLKTAGTISQVTYYGDSRQLFVQTATGQQLCATLRSEAPVQGLTGKVGEKVWLTWHPENCRILNDVG